jgi:hypothetical protein
MDILEPFRYRNARQVELGRRTEAGRLVRRRDLLGCAFAYVAVATLPAKPANASLNTIFDVTQPPYNADQSGATDCTSAFQAALDAIQSLGRGVLKVPSGYYTMDGVLTCIGADLSIVGDGQESSIIIVKHTATALSVQCTQSNQCATIRDIGFAPVPSSGGPAGVAISVTGLGAVSGWQGCSIQDVDVGYAYPGYTSFMQGVELTNVWRGRVDHVNMHSNVGPVPGSSFLSLSGCIDLGVTTCNVDQVAIPINIAGYCEGIRVQQCAFVGLVGAWTGPTGSPYSGNGSTTPFKNILDINFVDCEFNCSEQSLSLNYVNTALITGCHFAGGAPFATIHVFGSEKVQIESSDISGNFNAKSPQVNIGVKIEGSPIWQSAGNTVDNCLFTNLSCGVYFGGGSVINSATNIRMLAPGDGSLVVAPENFGSVVVAPYIDASGNSTNYASVIGAGLTASSSKTKQLTSRQ